MKNIEEMAILNHQQNMKYFETNHVKLYNKLTALDMLIEDGRYPQKYDLEYKNGYFDTIELSSQTYLYNQNSEIFSDSKTKEINFTKGDGVFNSSYNLYFSEETLNNLSTASPTTPYATTSQIMNYRFCNVNNSMHFKTINKFIFLGTGLGIHIPKIINKTGANIIFILEDDIELFRLSLFTCNYAFALKDCEAFFSIASSQAEFTNIFNDFYLNSFIYNYSLKFSIFSAVYEQRIKDIQIFLVSRSETCYPVEHILAKNLSILPTLNNNFKFLELSKKENETYFQDKPILVIAAGPSLEENIQWLKKNADNFILFAVFAALKILHRENIVPDIVIQIDEKEKETQELMNSFDNFDFLKKSIFIFSVSVPKVLLEKFDKNKIYLIEDRTSYRLAKTRLISASVGDTAFAISLIFNAKQIYMLGLDFALADDGSTHSKDHHRSESLDTSHINEVQSSVDIFKTVLHKKGNFREKVITTPLLAASIPKMNAFIQTLKSKTQTIYNLCDGVYFDNTIPLKVSDLNLNKKIDKREIEHELIKVFDTYALKDLSHLEKEALDKKLKQIDFFILKIENFKNNTPANVDIFLYNYANLIQSVLNADEAELKEILIIYFLTIAPHVRYLFNTKELKNTKKHVKNMKNIIPLQLYRLIDAYKEELVKCIDEK